MPSFKKCPWTPKEDMKLVRYISRFGIWNWSQMPKYAGLSRSGKSCRLRWLNYLNPEIKRGNFTAREDDIIIEMHENSGAGWSAIAARLPGRTDNEIKNRWHTHLKKRVSKNLVETIYRTEEMELDIDAANDSDYSSSSTPETQYNEEIYDDNPISSHMLNDKASSSNNNIVPPSYETSADPHISFWSQPFSSENVYDNNHPTYVAPEIELPMPQNWFNQPFTPCDCCNSWDYWFNFLTPNGSLEDH